MNSPWKKPVLVAFGEAGVYTSIATTRAASWALIEDWPVEDGAALDQALLVCGGVDAGRKKPEEARAAFIAAAIEANLDIKV